MQAVKFIEDMNDTEKAAVGVALSAGLVNLGNTCYMNSTVQCLRHMPELRHAIEVATPTSNPQARFAKALVETCKALDKSGSAISPHSLVSTMRAQFPQFMQGVREGHPAQQDAEELYGALAQSFQAALSEPSIIPGIGWDSLLGLELEETLACSESDAEKVVTKAEKVNKLICNIQNAVTQGSVVDHMQEGVRIGLEGTVEKHSDVLGRNALWTKKQRINKLPRYLCFHFMRFYWKATPDSRDHEGVKCKIMRSVTYPDAFDVYEFCSPGLQQALKANRDSEDKILDEQWANKRAKHNDEKVSAAGNSDTKKDESNAAMAVDGVDDEDAKALETALALSVQGPAQTQPSSVFGSLTGDLKSLQATANANPFSPNGLPERFTGMYELHSIVTHKGRTADGGHYMAWVRQEPGSTKFWHYNDDVVKEVEQAEIMLLCGGGDRDVAYLAFYRFRNPKA